MKKTLYRLSVLFGALGCLFGLLYGISNILSLVGILRKIFNK